MSRVFEILCSPSTARAAALALMTIGVAACSANTSRSNSNPEATGSISQTETTQPQQNSRARRRSLPTSNSSSARPAATPDITGSVVRKPTSAAKWRRSGDTAIKVAAAATTTVRRAEATSTEPRGTGADFAASWPDLPADARKPATTNNSYAEREPKGAQEEMPLIWPVLTEHQPAGPPDSASESVLMPALLAGALVMVLLCVGAIFRSSLGAARAHLLSFFQSTKFGRFS
jgi:hypothetical protein